MNITIALLTMGWARLNVYAMGTNGKKCLGRFLMAYNKPPRHLITRNASGL